MKRWAYVGYIGTDIVSGYVLARSEHDAQTQASYKVPCFMDHTPMVMPVTEEMAYQLTRLV